MISFFVAGKSDSFNENVCVLIEKELFPSDDDGSWNNTYLNKVPNY